MKKLVLLKSATSTFHLERGVLVEQWHDEDGGNGQHDDGEHEHEAPHVHVEVPPPQLNDLQHTTQHRGADNHRQQHALCLFSVQG